MKALAMLTLGFLCCMEIPAQSSTLLRVGRCSPETNFVDRSVLVSLAQVKGVSCIISDKESQIQDYNILGVEYEFNCYVNGFHLHLNCDSNAYLWADFGQNSIIYDQTRGEEK